MWFQRGFKPTPVSEGFQRFQRGFKPFVGVREVSEGFRGVSDPRRFQRGFRWVSEGRKTKRAVDGEAFFRTILQLDVVLKKGEV